MNQTNFNKIADEESLRFHAEAKGYFKKLELDVETLDTGGGPDYLIQTKDHKFGFICECKYISSAGTLDNGKYHISSIDRELAKRNKGPFTIPQKDPILGKMHQALGQFESLLNKKPEFKKYPFVVFFKLDFYADDFDFLRRDLDGLTQISAVMVFQIDEERERLWKGMTSEDIKKIINREKTIKLPPPTKKLKILLNERADNKLEPANFLENYTEV